MEDVNGAMTGLLHVWSVYQQDADDVIAGIMFGMPSKPLSSEDMLILAEHARKFQFFVEEIALRQEYLKRVQLEGKERIKFISKIAQAYHNVSKNHAINLFYYPPKSYLHNLFSIIILYMKGEDTCNEKYPCF